MGYNKSKTKFNGHKIFIKEGYECIDDGKFKYVHRLIMEEYLNRPLKTKENIHHIDGNKRNNSKTNLNIINHSEHARHHAPENFPYDPKGSRNGMARLNEQKVREIIPKVNCESDIQSVADEYGVHYVTIWDIWKCRTWKHVER